MLAVMSGASLCDTTSDVKKHNKTLQQTCDALTSHLGGSLNTPSSSVEQSWLIV